MAPPILLQSEPAKTPEVKTLRQAPRSGRKARNTERNCTARHPNRNAPDGLRATLSSEPCVPFSSSMAPSQLFAQSAKHGPRLRTSHHRL